MLIHEYRVIMPLTVEEYQIGSLYTIAQVSKEETGGSEGVEIIKNEPFSNYPLLDGKYSSGQYTFKIYHVEKKMPTLLRMITPKGSKEVHEECWNAYPFCKTVITNPGYMKDNFRLEIITLHSSDRGTENNALNLPPDLLQQREVSVIDIANDPVSPNDYTPQTDPQLFKSAKTGRGPLTGNWIETVTPVMTCYKLVNINFKWFGIQGKVERVIQKFEKRVFTVLNRKVFCALDEWFGLSLEDVRKIEEETRSILSKQIKHGPLKGTTEFA